MVFKLLSGRMLVVEYDGAYWHRGQEERDFHKARMLEDAWRDQGCVVVRIREDPLIPLGPVDVQVPGRSDALTCTRLVLLHLLHMIPGDIEDRYAEAGVGSFLRSTRRPLLRSDVRCETCEYVAREILPAEIFEVSIPVERVSARRLPIGGTAARPA
jgi:hypothetical protein